MGIMGRVKEIATADIHHMLDRFEDPISMAKHYIRQVEEQIDRAREALSNQFAAEQQYDVLISKTGQIVSKRIRQAELAVDRNEDAIAEIALQDKLHHQKLLITYENQRDMLRKQSEVLKEEISRLTDIHQELQFKLLFLVTQANAACAIEQAAFSIQPFETDKLTRGFARMEEKVGRVYAGANAYRQTNTQANALYPLEPQDEVRSELEKLKAARGK